MFKKPCFREPLDRQHRKWVETLLQTDWADVFLEKAAAKNMVR